MLLLIFLLIIQIMHYIFHLFEKSREDTTLGEVKGAWACGDVDVDKKRKG